ncbi:secondary thiamine-phosphate synthase enzyme YjbQ [Acidobacteriota bacterium]
MEKKEFEINTQTKEEFIDLTSKVRTIIGDSGIQTGVCTVFIPHTTAGVTINENADPSVQSDILRTLKTIVPETLPYTHMEGNSPAHVKAGLMGSSVSIIIHNGDLVLGTWQGIYFCEFDGPRRRKVYLNAC